MILYSCSDNTILSDTEILGEWKLIEAKIVNFSSSNIIDYSSINITYNFLPNGKLLITRDNIGHTNGEYKYILEKDFLADASSPEEETILLLKINDKKWTYRKTKNQMIIGQSYVDGPDLILERN